MTESIPEKKIKMVGLTHVDLSRLLSDRLQMQVHLSKVRARTLRIRKDTATYQLNLTFLKDSPPPKPTKTRLLARRHYIKTKGYNLERAILRNSDLLVYTSTSEYNGGVVTSRTFPFFYGELDGVLITDDAENDGLEAKIRSLEHKKDPAANVRWSELHKSIKQNLGSLLLLPTLGGHLVQRLATEGIKLGHPDGEMYAKRFGENASIVYKFKEGEEMGEEEQQSIVDAFLPLGDYVSGEKPTPQFLSVVHGSAFPTNNLLEFLVDATKVRMASLALDPASSYGTSYLFINRDFIEDFASDYSDQERRIRTNLLLGGEVINWVNLVEAFCINSMYANMELARRMIDESMEDIGHGNSVVEASPRRADTVVSVEDKIENILDIYEILESKNYYSLQDTDPVAIDALQSLYVRLGASFAQHKMPNNTENDNDGSRSA